MLQRREQSKWLRILFDDVKFVPVGYFLFVCYCLLMERLKINVFHEDILTKHQFLVPLFVNKTIQLILTLKPGLHAHFTIFTLLLRYTSSEVLWM